MADPEPPPPPDASGSATATASPSPSPTATATATPTAPDRWSFPLAVAIPSVVLFSRLGYGGIWDPHELNVAELARRVAIHVYGARGLVLAGADNSMPRIGELGKNELPVDSVALGFRLFGLHEWSGRFPLAIWGLAGALSLYWLLARLVDRRAGLYGAVALVTMPLYFVQARTILGDIVTMAASAMAFAGLGVATFDREDRPGGERRVGRARAAGLLLGLAGLGAGFLSRGALVGVAMPALGVGLAWALGWVSGRPRRNGWGDAAGALALAAGVAAAVVGTRALLGAKASEYSVLVGAPVQASVGKFPTYDFVVHYLGHALFPWSAFVPLAVGRLLRAPPNGAASSDRDAAARVSLLVGAAVAYGVYSVVAPRCGALAFGAPALLAGIAAVAVRDFERGAPASRALALGVAVLCGLFLRDFNMFPEKGLSAYAVGATNFPDSFRHQAETIVFASTVLFVGVLFFAWLETDADAGVPPGAPRSWRRAGLRPGEMARGVAERFRDEYLAWPRFLAKAWEGNLLFGAIVVEVALSAVALGVYVGVVWFKWRHVLQMGVPVRLALLNAFWVLPAGVFGAVWGAMAARDAFRWLLRVTGLGRGTVTIGAGLAVGLLFAFGYYPALAAQLSPKEVFDAYARLHRTGEPLALLGVTGRTASYYSGGDVKSFSDVPSAHAWLSQGPERKWLVARNDDLLRLNSLYRAGSTPRRNIPVLDARSSQILLVSNQLPAVETNRNPLGAIVLDAEPRPSHAVHANLQDQIESLGWEVFDGRNRNRVEWVVPGRKYHMHLYWNVIGQISGEWETFIHIDGYHRRYNGDHKTTGGKYPMNLWQIGDFIDDDHEFTLEPNFTPGTYTVLYGLFIGETRMKVKVGRHDDNRVDAGPLRVQ